MNRRTLLSLSLALLGAPPFRAAAFSAAPGVEASETEIIPLWPGPPPGGGGPSGPVRVGTNGAVSHIARPQMEVFRPARPNGAAMLVAAGGGYRRIQMRSEAEPAARWLTAHGITAFVLSYRLPPEGWNAGPLAPLQDAQRALRLIRARAGEGALDPARLGVLGFSAGGHLLGLASGRAAFAAYPPGDAADALSARPDAAALIYPVITLEPPYDRTSTRRALIGDHPTPQQSADWSVETHVGPHCPPVFLVQALDDRISNPANSRIMDAACRRSGVPVALHQPATGGHGFAMGRPETASADWPDWFAAWLGERRMLG